MKRAYLILALLLVFSLACAFGGQANGEGEAISQSEQPQQSEKKCGDGVCDGPENINNCAQDCGDETGITPEENEVMEGFSEHLILYHLVENSVTSIDISGIKCYTFNFRQYLDGGYVRIDGSENNILELRDHPTSMVTSRKHDKYYYISSPTNPVYEAYGFEVFDWDIEGQNLWTSEFTLNNPVVFTAPVESQFPGGVAASPENRYLVYPQTRNATTDQDQAESMLSNAINPYVSDSSLIVANLKNNGESKALPDRYNRQLFTSFADFSADGSSFYTIGRQGQGFEFVKISLESGITTGFAEVFPGFDWASVDWDAFFPQANDFAYAKINLSPDETRLIAYKNIFAASPQNPCVSEGSHHLWVFDLETNTVESFKNQPGYASDSAWKVDSSQFALALLKNGGCYPDYMDARIDVLDKNGENSSILVEEPKSKITNIGWSPDGSVIVYDVYTTDYIGRLKLVDVTTKQATEIINTQALGYTVSQSNPVTLFFANWVLTE
jgi:hypothetical protein